MAIENIPPARHSLVFIVFIGSTMVGPGKSFQNRRSTTAGKRYFEFGSC